MHEHAGGRAIAHTAEHGRPEQGVEVDDVLADEMIELGAVTGLPVSIEVIAAALAEHLEAGHVAHGRIQPHVEVFARLVGNLEAEIRCIAADVPLLQPAVQPLAELVGDGFLQRAAACPGLEHVGEGRQREEEVLGVFLHRSGARQCGARVDQVGRAVGSIAGFTVVAVLVGCLALRAGALDEAVGQEQILLGVEQLRDAPTADEAPVAHLAVEILRQPLILWRVRGVKLREADVEARIVTLMFRLNAGDQRFGRDALALCPQHDGGAVGVIGTDVHAVLALELLEAHPDVGLHGFQHVAKVNGAVGIGQRTGDEDSACHAISTM